MSQQPALVIVSDVDGTLLDAQTYALGAAEAVVRELRQAGVSLVLCSSKTRAEIEALMASLDLDEAFICENGGALYVPWRWSELEGDPAPVGLRRKIELGHPYGEVTRAVRETAAALGVGVRGFADMTIAEIADDCGLTPLQAQLAKLREYDEPFRVVDRAPRALSAVLRALQARGLRTLEGGRYAHALGGTDKGRAVRVLRDVLRGNGPSILMGLGDAPNDLAMLEEVDLPVIVRRLDVPPDRLLRAVPKAAVTEQPGPAGWAVAVRATLDRWRAGRSLKGSGW